MAKIEEFARDIEDRTGSRKIVLFKDYLGIGERAARAGNVDAAIGAYGATQKEQARMDQLTRDRNQMALSRKADDNGPTNSGRGRKR